jgi:hypothetical protein
MQLIKLSHWWLEIYNVKVHIIAVLIAIDLIPLNIEVYLLKQRLQFCRLFLAAPPVKVVASK